MQQLQKAGKKDVKTLQMAAFFASVLEKVTTILKGFDDAKHSIKLVGNKNQQVKSLLDQLERDLNALRNKSRRH